jgi:drug/metabolite transporter (DMT)-like permease
MKKEHHGFLYGLVAALVSAVMAILMKWLPVSLETIAFFRFAVGLPLVWAVAHMQGVRVRFKEMPKHLVRGFFGFLSVYSYVYALRVIPIVNAITLGNTAPLFMPFVVLFWLKKVVSKQRFIATAIGFIGVCILLRPGVGIFEIGSLLGLVTGIASAVALMGVKELSKEESSITILLYYFLFFTIAAFYPMVITWEPITNLYVWLGLIGVGVASLLFQYCLTKAYTHAAATKVSMFNYLAIVFGGLGAWICFGEVPDLWVWVGAGLIVLGAILAIVDQTPPRPFKMDK